jgi:hypothetical protein
MDAVGLPPFAVAAQLGHVIPDSMLFVVCNTPYDSDNVLFSW